MITKRNRQDELRSNLVKEYVKLDSFDEFKMTAMVKYGCHIGRFNLFSWKYHCYSGQWYDVDCILLPVGICFFPSILVSIVYLLINICGLSPNINSPFNWTSVLTTLSITLISGVFYIYFYLLKCQLDVLSCEIITAEKNRNN